MYPFGGEAQTFRVGVASDDGPQFLNTDKIGNCAGRFAPEILTMLGRGLPVYYTFQ